MSEEGDTAKMSVAEREALATSMLHYGSVAEATTVSFINVFALFNGGALAASVALIATEVGQSIMLNMRWAAVSAILLFALGLILALVLKGIVLLFAIRRYRTYRDTLVNYRRGWNAMPFSAMMAAGVGLFVAICFTTIFGIGLAIIIVANA